MAKNGVRPSLMLDQNTAAIIQQIKRRQQTTPQQIQCVQEILGMLATGGVTSFCAADVEQMVTSMGKRELWGLNNLNELRGAIGTILTSLDLESYKNSAGKVYLLNRPSK